MEAIFWTSRSRHELLLQSKYDETQNRVGHAQILQLLKFCLRTYFTFDGTIYEQVKGTPMSTTISGYIAEAVLQRLESLVFQHHKPKFWDRYVDVTFVVSGRDQVMTFQEHLNAVFPDIQFTMEEEENNQLAFLDVLKQRDESQVAVLKKKTQQWNQSLVRRRQRRRPRASLLMAQMPREVLSKVERDALRELKADKDLVIVPADKGHSTVMLDRTDYLQKAKGLLEDRRFNVPCATNPVKALTREINATFLALENSGAITPTDRRMARPQDTALARFYGLPTVHKDGAPLRPIVSLKGTQTTSRSRHELLLQSKYDETQNRVGHAQILQLLEFCLRTYFTFDGTVYEQVKGTSMGSPISGFIAEAVLQRLESLVF
ncbi:hypothetical protein SprV_0802480100 [Sparganum proliferum]